MRPPLRCSELMRKMTALLVGVVLVASARAQGTAFRTYPQSQFVRIGQTVTLSASFGGGPYMLQWMKNGIAIPGATASSLAVTVASAADAASYAIVATDRVRSETSAPAVLYLSRLTNFSVLAAVGPASPSITLGHVIAGRGSVALLRAVGPTLAEFGVRDALADPRLTVARTFPVVSNAGWSTAENAGQLAEEARRLGAFPLPSGSADAAVRSAVEGAVFSADLGSASGGSGTVLVELYHADSSPLERLINVSARARIAVRDERITAGFVLAGEGRTTLLVRAIGPSLTALGVSGALMDPRLEMFPSGTGGGSSAGGGAPIARNDNWGGSAALAAAFARAGAFALAGVEAKDAAVLVSLEPGDYTVQVSGSDGSVGEVLVEIYVVP